MSNTLKSKYVKSAFFLMIIAAMATAGVTFLTDDVSAASRPKLDVRVQEYKFNGEIGWYTPSGFGDPHTIIPITVGGGTSTVRGEIKNVGDAPLIIDSLSIESFPRGVHNAMRLKWLKLGPNRRPERLPITLEPGEKFPFWITFGPVELKGRYRGKVSIGHNDRFKLDPFTMRPEGDAIVRPIVRPLAKR